MPWRWSIRSTPIRSSSCRMNTWRRMWRARPGSTSFSRPRRIHRPERSAGADLPGDLDYQLIGWHGRCEVHEKFTVKDIETVRAQFPDVVILAHPECSPEVTAAADFSGSHQCHDPLRPAVQSAALPAADRMRHGRQRGRRQPARRTCCACAWCAART